MDEAFEIEPPTYENTPVFIPVASFIHGDYENEIYWFHPDHLGSSSYITNFVGEVSQHMEYFAFGETFVEEHRSSNNSPYKFNGKELDEETGWYYYGARYYDPRISVWLSVDPLMEQTMQPYQYTYQNPLRYIDPTGMIGEDPPRGTYKFNQDGNYIGFEKYGWFKTTFGFNSRGSYESRQGKTVNFRFASGKADAQTIENNLSNGQNPQLHILTSARIKGMLREAGVYRNINQNNSLDFMMEQGVGTGSLDFSTSALSGNFEGTSNLIDNSSAFFIAEKTKIAHNQFNFGNFLIGAAAEQLNVMLDIMLGAAHYNSLENPDSNSYESQWDSLDDQSSIMEGYRYGREVLRNTGHLLIGDNASLETGPQATKGYFWEKMKEKRNEKLYR